MALAEDLHDVLFLSCSFAIPLAVCGAHHRVGTAGKAEAGKRHPCAGPDNGCQGVHIGVQGAAALQDDFA